MTSIERTLVIPLRNEQNRVGVLLNELRLWPALSVTEVLLVDDGSTDKTRSVVREFLESTGVSSARLLSLGAPAGKGATVQAGMLAAKGRYAVFTDVDLPFGFDGIERLFFALQRGVDVAVGARDLSESDLSAAPLARRFASIVFRMWVRLVSDTGRIRDTQCGLKGFTRNAAQLLFSNLRCRGLAFDIEILGRASHAGLKVKRIPVTIRDSTTDYVNFSLAGLSLFVTAPVAGWNVRINSTCRAAKPSCT